MHGDPAQNTKARGFVERSEIKVLGALSRIEVDRYLRGECGLPGIPARGGHAGGLGHARQLRLRCLAQGSGPFPDQTGRLPGIPINVEMCPLEKSGFNDTNLKWHA